MSEKRGSKLLKGADRYIGSLLLLVLAFLLSIKKVVAFIKSHKSTASDLQQNKTVSPNAEASLLICLGAIGDLILLTEAAKARLNGKSVYLACSNSNYACAKLYQDFYAGIELINVRSLSSIHRVCQKNQISTIFDSTQWANIGAILTGVARLLNSSLSTYGFITKNPIRNYSYTYTVEHLSTLHEVGNFSNLLSPSHRITSNQGLSELLPELYSNKPINNSKKVLFHLWPSGAKSYLKEWPKTHWIDLANYFFNLGYTIYLSGSADDTQKNESFIQESGLHLINIAGKYDLYELSNFVSTNIELAVSVNTGILHLVASLNVPVIGLHGPTNPERWGPLGAHSIALLPKSGLSAYLNYGFEYPSDDRLAYSLHHLDVKQAIEAHQKISSKQA
jgi:hypothetical protein